MGTETAQPLPLTSSGPSQLIAMFRRVRSLRLLRPSPAAVWWLSGLSVASMAVMGFVPWDRAPQPAFPHYPLSLCANRATRVVLAIRSAPDRLELRNSMRRTIASKAVRAVLPGWQFLFYMGFVNGTATMNSVLGEISKHGDVLVTSIEATLGNSALITLDVVRWVLDRCSKRKPLRLFVHTNDTMFVDPVAFQEFSRKMKKTKRPTVHCQRAPAGAVKDDANTVTSVPRYVFWPLSIPPACEGDAFFVQGSHLAWLYATSLRWLHYALLLQRLNSVLMFSPMHIGFYNISRLIGEAESPKNSTQSSNITLPSETKLFLAGGLNDTWDELGLEALLHGATKTVLNNGTTNHSTTISPGQGK